MIADRVVLLDRGRVVADARPEDLVDGASSTARTEEPELLTALLAEHSIDVQRQGDQFLVGCSAEVLGRLTAAHRIPLSRLDTGQGGDLESIFLRLTEGEFAVQRSGEPT